MDPKTKLIKSAPTTSKLHESKPQSLPTTSTLLNISKLCSWVEVKKEAEAQHVRTTSNNESKSSESSKPNPVIHDAWVNTQDALLTLSAQQLIHEKKSILQSIRSVLTCYILYLIATLGVIHFLINLSGHPMPPIIFRIFFNLASVISM